MFCRYFNDLHVFDLDQFKVNIFGHYCTMLTLCNFFKLRSMFVVLLK